jgi:hypothetical protein
MKCRVGVHAFSASRLIDAMAVLAAHGVSVVCRVGRRAGRAEWFLVKAVEPVDVQLRKNCCVVHEMCDGGERPAASHMVFWVEYGEEYVRKGQRWHASVWDLKAGAVKNVLNGVHGVLSGRKPRELWREGPLVFELMGDGSLLAQGAGCVCSLGRPVCTWCAENGRREVPLILGGDAPLWCCGQCSSI